VEISQAHSLECIHPFEIVLLPQKQFLCVEASNGPIELVMKVMHSSMLKQWVGQPAIVWREKHQFSNKC
jgi:hypothetical protein